APRRHPRAEAARHHRVRGDRRRLTDTVCLSRLRGGWPRPYGEIRSSDVREWPMGKFDGMDPQLVRELLGETKRAAVELRETEARVSRVLSRAGVATQTTHRPRQVADEADRMVKDVSARLDLLEKRAAGESPSTDPPPDDNGTKTPEPDAKNPAPTKPDAEGRDEKPEQKKPDARGDKPDAKPEGDGKREDK